MAKNSPAKKCKRRKVSDIMMENEEEYKIKRETHNTGI